MSVLMRNLMIGNSDDDDEIEIDYIPELDGEKVDHGADDVANSKGNAAPEMMGHASRPFLDDSGKCVILCHAPRKENISAFPCLPRQRWKGLLEILASALEWGRG
ncbi:hypothetical protein TIFTF001_024301 [Ficus carica]|uniref:Uncharacterized protein n=1 Tax=Ficus carica TaxID=3494 RepID=A0AA88DKC4_FICCA|nr:hypothetical protein TIFTF001_024301 [Ficus carica]